MRRAAAGYEREADQRRAELIATGVGLLPGSKPLTTPGRKLTAKEWEKEAEPLEPHEASKFRQLDARANFLASDRPDIAFAVKELCRGMAAPTTRGADAIKKLDCYLLGQPRAVVLLGWQEPPKALDVFSDSDWAGCVRTRRSTQAARCSGEAAC